MPHTAEKDKVKKDKPWDPLLRSHYADSPRKLALEFARFLGLP
ncbi:hypothetical protein [Streptomyces mutabilis]